MKVKYCNYKLNNIEKNHEQSSTINFCNDMYVYRDSVVEYEVKFNVHAQTVQ